MRTYSVITRALLVPATVALLTASAQAQFNAARGNLLWASRDVNGGARGPFDIVVDLGSYTRFTSGGAAILLGGSSASDSYQGQLAVSENRFAASDVSALFGNLDNVLWSAFGINSGAAPSANSAWLLTRARTDVNTQSTPWNRASAITQGQTGNKMETVRNNAVNSGVDYNNTSTQEDAGVTAAYGNAAISPFTGFGAMEANTGSGFSGVVRADLYNVLTGTGPSQYLGYFEYQSDGDLWWVPQSFVPVPEASAYGLVAGAGMLLLALRRQLAGKTA